ncbi:hypothetical protein A3Q56_04483 [Intoshia linei]|uniref:dual-specificity kinase n=1 Tax=Intoshia linei TaxID=1819745 RepID=A0A177B0J1_9BILA|nr:hypothetical protein A3Q56_04483 [Intoshia linei]
MGNKSCMVLPPLIINCMGHKCKNGRNADTYVKIPHKNIKINKDINSERHNVHDSLYNNRLNDLHLHSDNNIYHSNHHFDKLPVSYRIQQLYTDNSLHKHNHPPKKTINTNMQITSERGDATLKNYNNKFSFNSLSKPDKFLANYKTTNFLDKYKKNNIISYTSKYLHIPSSNKDHSHQNNLYKKIISGYENCNQNDNNGIAKTKFNNPETVMKTCMHKLSTYEHTEIFFYPQIFFIGANAKKKNGIIGGDNNCGYDDDKGSYLVEVHDHVIYRYEILKILGKGSFGIVVKSFDHKLKTYVALKMIRNEKRFHKQAQEEVRILEHLKKQDVDNKYNIVIMYDHFIFRNHICMTFELLSVNLYELIKKNKFQGHPLSLIKKIAHQILMCLEALYKNKIIHCDLKPENILIKYQGRSDIKVIDFGSSCYEHQRIYTYIQSRFYRAPEIILGCRYGMPIDMWSFACILVELYIGFPIFPGINELDQLSCIIELLGMPPSRILQKAKRISNYIDSNGYPKYCKASTDKNGNVILNGSTNYQGKFRGPPSSKTIKQILKGCDDVYFQEFIIKCFDWDPSTRMTPSQAFKHDWIRGVQRKSNDSTATNDTYKPYNHSSSFKNVDSTIDIMKNSKKYNQKNKSKIVPKLPDIADVITSNV